MGACVLVDRWHVLTCAHVVAAGGGQPPGPEPPPGRLPVRFPYADDGPGDSTWTVDAEVADGGWIPATDDGRGDIALLKLTSPAPPTVTVAVLDLGEGTEEIRAFGHPVDQSHGVWADVRLDGVGGPRGEWMQVASSSDVGRRVERGFSGAGAVDRRSGKIVGIIVAEDPAAGNRVAWMIRMEVVVDYLPNLAPLIGGPPAVPDAPTGGRPAAVRTPSRRLGDEQLKALFGRLWAVPGMPDRPSRDFYLRAVEDRLASRLEFTRHAADRLDLWAMMVALLERPGAIRALTGFLAGMHDDHPSMAHLAELVDVTFPEPLLEPDERASLEALLAGVSWRQLGAAHRHATRRLGVLPVMRPSSAAVVMADLEDRGRAPGDVPPLLRFVDELAHAMGGRLANDLHAWLDDVAGRLGVPPADRRDMCAEAVARHRTSATVHVVVVLQPDGMDAERFLVSAVAVVGDGLEEPERTVFRDDVPRTLAEVERVLDEHVLPFVPEAVGGVLEGLVLELVLPQRLLGLTIEDWKFDRAIFPRPLGIRYPVVVRSLERMLDRASHDVWRRKSRQLREYGQQADVSGVHHVDRDARSVPQPPEEAIEVYSKIAVADELVVLSVPFPPSDTLSAADHPDVFTAGVSAGMPVIVWCRVPWDPGWLRSLIESKLLAEGPTGLPQQVLRYRLERRGATSVGSPAIGVLYDDALRIPPQARGWMQLRSPGRAPDRRSRHASDRPSGTDEKGDAP